MSGLEGIDFSNFSLRATMNDLKNVNVYTDNNSFRVSDAISFDIEAENISALNYFCGSLLASVMKILVSECKSQGIVIEEIEGKIDYKLTNPLRVLNVRGYEDLSEIEDIVIKIYYYADGDEEELNNRLMGMLNANPIYSLLKSTKKVDCKIQLII
ncbi:OsmC family peroxiredoxin [uncultured Ezakiella sp.]|mgnify:FL=1|uniref:OsmC family peroxiredoxin n=1 Tax=uncultured Ezakiella sp. TaxID=1637529 RepID=UPI0025F4E9F2|nr:OsmC family peroxiredoxin [uncultured Ezakiella sp.]